MLVTLLLGACASGPPVTVTQDPDMDLSAYRTFGFVDPLSIEETDIRNALSGLLLESATAELQGRGLTRSAGPDLLVDFAVIPPAKATAKDRNPPAAPINTGIGRSSGWSSDSRDLDYSLKQTPKDTITINLIDRQLEQAVWTARVREYVTSKTGDELQTRVTEVVAVLLAQYPVGQSRNTTTQ